MLRFVLLYHECPAEYERASHWDLMLEAEGVLRTWAVEQLPRGWDAARSRTAARYGTCAATSVATTVDAMRLADHRIGYLEEEGPLSGGRGEMLRIDAGTYETVTQDSQSWQVVLTGQVVRGQVTLGPSTLRNAGKITSR